MQFLVFIVYADRFGGRSHKIMSIQNINSSVVFRCFSHRWRAISINCRFVQTNSEVKKTALYDFHVSKGGKMVNFGNYLLPVQYSDQGISASHLHTRKFASIFDVSHMLQTFVRGKAAIECFESICTADLRVSLKRNNCCLTVFTDNQGNILDDLIVSKIENDWLYVVSNAAMRSQDMDIMKNAVQKYSAAGKDVSVEFHCPTERSLIAFQGPAVAKILSDVAKSCDIPFEQLYFMNTTEAEVSGVSGCRITRCGYTGEDGVEISIPSQNVRHVTESILASSDAVRLAGLGARDSLRLEAGLCLYGTDIDAGVTPVEAALSWLVPKRRREELNFPGATRIVDQLKNGVERRRIGLRMVKGPPARAGVPIVYNGKIVGHVTSGCPSPSLGGNIAMGYMKEESRKSNVLKQVQLTIRNKMYQAEISAMPFVPSKYYTKTK